VKIETWRRGAAGSLVLKNGTNSFSPKMALTSLLALSSSIINVPEKNAMSFSSVCLYIINIMINPYAPRLAILRDPAVPHTP
jgi:hypothetical protein